MRCSVLQKSINSPASTPRSPLANPCAVLCCCNGKVINPPLGPRSNLMPHVRSGQADIYWRADGDLSLPALLLSNSIGTDFSIWDTVLPRLMRHFRVIRMDTRGHGASSAPNGDYSLQQLADDVDAVVNAAGVESFFFCGVSLGGMIGMQYAAQRPAKLRKLVLCNTSAVMDPAAWETRRAKVLADGLESIVDMGMSRFFTPEYVARNNVEFQ